MKRINYLLLLLPIAAVRAQPNTATVKQKAFVLKRFMELNHYQPLVWNDTSSAMLYNKWIDELDEEKLFFTQKDIALLEPYKTRLDDELLGKSTAGQDFFSLSVLLFERRLQKTDSIIKAALAKPADFSKVDNISWPYTTFAASEPEIAQRWQKYLKWKTLNYIADYITDDEKTVAENIPADFTKLELKAREKLKQGELAYIKSLLKTPKEFIADKSDSYLDAIAWCYDPHSSYMNIKLKKEFETMLSASEYSAGFDLEENDKGDLNISYLQPGGSAWRSGQLHTGDILIKVKVNGNEKRVEDLAEGELDRFLTGSSQDDLEITVKTASGEMKTVKLSKEKVSDDGSVVKSYVLRSGKNVGYINLPGFYSRELETIRDENDIKYDGCANDVSKEIVKLKKDSIAGLILDLRNNGGGSMWEAMQLAGIFIDIGPVASVKDKEGKVHFLKDPNRGTIYDGPMMVLINGASASASEFTSAVLQDYNRALIVGGITYGKGTAQSVMPLDTSKTPAGNNYMDFVKVTGQKFYRVNGSTVQWKGVIPDILLPDMYADDSFKEKANISALQPDNSKKGMYQPLEMLPVQTLKVKCEQRIATDGYFKAISDFGKWINVYKSGRVIPLDWAGYATHYKKTMEMYKLVGEDEKHPSSITVSNNAFDRERINLSTNKSKEINEAYLDQLRNDHYVTEAYNIMIDWLKQ